MFRIAPFFPLLVLLTTISTLSGLVAAIGNCLTSDANRPAEVRATEGITCLGPLPPWRLPITDGVDPNTFTLQELCTKPEHGGRAGGRNLGFFCAIPRAGVVGHDNSDEAQIWHKLNNHRTRLYCRQRCFCDYGNADRSVQPLRVPWFYRALERDELKYSIDVDAVSVANDWVGFLGYQSASQITERSLGTKILFLPLYPNCFQLAWEQLAIDRANRITCDGPLPAWPLPAPFAAADFPSLQSLCPVQLSGGNMEANAGGYCHRNNDGTRDVAFTDEMTPRLEWTWDNFQASSAVRFHCWQHCRCAGLSRPENRTLNNLWHVLNDLSIIRDVDGSIKAQKGVGGTASSLTVLPPSTSSDAPASGTCGADGRQFCQAPWPEEVLGPKPRLPLGPAVLAPDPPPRHRPPNPPAEQAPPELDASAQTNPPIQPTCGAECLSNKNCAGSGTAGECRCVVPGLLEAKAQGLDPIFPKALCLLVNQLFVKGAKNPKRAATGRSSMAGDEEWACACNQTYVSRSCCDSPDGMVWEHPRRRLGRLGRGHER
ncbi:MAG: hypothetical protein M1817_005094 [Caeruleum heppii]|nr:MAG: hypothetical protein M1817_005094 [Caeruleum heppii]